MQRILVAFGLAVFLASGWTPRALAQKTEVGLIAAWEQAQKADPSTTKFEKIKDRDYHFATKRFPFDGELLVRNVVMEDFPGLSQDGNSIGTLEVELQGTTDDFHRTFARSYAQWNMSNTLYWDPKTTQWQTSERYLQEARGRIPMQVGIWPALLGLGWLGVFVFVFVFGLLFFRFWQYNSRMKLINQRGERVLQISEQNGKIAERNAQIIEQGLKIQQENAKIFQEILEELKKLSERR
jgi:hypothetical protein